MFERLALKIMSDKLPSTDVLRPFQLEASQLRGRMVRMDDTINRIISAHNYPNSVSSWLVELLVLAGGLAGGLKYQGTFSLQIRGDGPINLMVADMRNDGVLRGYASFDEERVAHAQTDDELIGKGVLAITVDQRPTGGEVYQGIVELDQHSLQESMLRYFHQSEQIPTGIKAAIQRDPHAGRWSGAAIIIQAMPGEQGLSARDREDDWRRTMMLLESATGDELLDPGLSVDQMLFRLFHEDGVRVFDPLDISFGCSCDETRVRNVLSQFDQTEMESMTKPDGDVHVTCEFCSRIYRFDDKAIRDILNHAS